MKTTALAKASASRRGLTTAQMLLLAATALVILFFGARQYKRYFGTVTVVVAKEALPAGGAIADNQLRTKRLDKGVVPPDAIRRSADVIGRRIQVAVEKGAVL